MQKVTPKVGDRIKIIGSSQNYCRRFNLIGKTATIEMANDWDDGIRINLRTPEGLRHILMSGEFIIVNDEGLKCRKI